MGEGDEQKIIIEAALKNVKVTIFNAINTFKIQITQ